MKKNLILFMGVLLALAWYVTASSWLGNGKKYQGYIQEAKRLEEKGLYLDAIEEYKLAKELKADSLEIDEYIADAYLGMGAHKEYKSQLNEIIDKYGPVEADVKKLYEFYQQYSSENSRIDWVKEMHEKYPDSEIVKSYYQSCQGAYTEQYLYLDKIEAFHGKYAVFELKEKKGLLNTKGDMVVKAVHDDIIYNGKDADRITVKDGGQYFFINTKGYKTEAPEEVYEFIGMLSQKRIPAEKNGKYGYLNENLKEAIAFSYDNALPFQENVAAVKSGENWMLINRKGEKLTQDIYKDIAINSQGFCNAKERIFAETDEGWSILSLGGERITSEVYENANAFEAEGVVAVCRNGSWGFVDTEGNLVIDFQYEEAKSFKNGFAPVKHGGLWGYIDKENNMVVTPAFEAAEQMTSKGVAPVQRGGVWTLIELKILN